MCCKLSPPLRDLRVTDHRGGVTQHGIVFHMRWQTLFSTIFSCVLPDFQTCNDPNKLFILSLLPGVRQRRVTTRSRLPERGL